MNIGTGKQDMERLSYLRPKTSVLDNTRRHNPRVQQAVLKKLVVSRWSYPVTAIALISILLIAWRYGSEHVNCVRKSNKSPLDKILEEVPLIDGHNDLPIVARFVYGNHLYNGDFTNDSALLGQVDFPRLRRGRLRGQFWSIFQSCPSPSKDMSILKTAGQFSDELYYENVHDILQQIDLVKRLIVAFPDNLVSATSSKDIWSNFRSSRRISSLMGVEGLHSIGNSVSVLRLYHQLGVRYVTLTHFCHNKYADSASQPPFWNGLSQDGRAVIAEMNRMGMVVDLAHTSADTMRQTLEAAQAPVIFSHASSYTVCPHPRNVPDDVLLKLKVNDGVIMVTFVPEYTNCDDPNNASLSDVADHIEHVGRLIGYRHVGIGSDFDGMLTAPKGLEDVSTYPKLLEELLSRGVSIEDMKGIVGGNVLRVLQEVELTSARMVEVKPLEDYVKKANFSSPEKLGKQVPCL